MKVALTPVGQVVPYARNPRKNDAAVAKVAASIKEFGFRQPIVVDEEMVVIAGHTRLLAARQLGVAKVPVHIAEGLTDTQAKAYRLADNRTGQDAEWDMDLLGLEMRDLDAEGFDLDLTGFGEMELQSLMADKTEGLTDPDEVPPVPDDPVTKPGDTWILGKHRLRCGDSTSADDVSALLVDVEPHLMVTDPPYGVEYDATWRKDALPDTNPGKSGGMHGAVKNDDNADWSEAWALFPGDVAYVWHADRMGVGVGVGVALMEMGFDLRAMIIWAKNNMVIGRGDYHPKHEPCWYAVKKNKKGHYCGGRKQTTVWDIDKPLKSETGHSTQKPVECMKRPIENNSSPGQAVYDPFLGSGTTVIAAEMTGRQCLGLEIAPAYCDVIVKRWQGFTGEQAKLEGSGDLFPTIKNANAA